jgi:protein-tyrosine phosphatase
MRNRTGHGCPVHLGGHSGNDAPLPIPAPLQGTHTVERMRILFVCTGNMCRSPLAERLTSAWVDQRLGTSANAVRLDSAGTDAHEGRPMDGRSAQALAELGGDATGFTSRLLARGEAEHADLVLTMSRRHRHTLLKHAPRALRRTFTLPEAASLFEMVETRGIESLPLTDRAQELSLRLNEARARRRTSREDDIPDPVGRPLAEHRQVGAQIAACLEPLMDVLLAPVVAVPHSGVERGGFLPSLPPVPPVRSGVIPPDRRFPAAL